MDNKKNSKNMLNWFPGHMKKSLNDLQAQLKNIDAVICVLDARAPYSCINPELEKICAGKNIIYAINKIDLADANKNKLWEQYFKGLGKTVLLIDSTKNSCKSSLIKAINIATKDKQEKQKSRGILLKIRVAIVGVPNTGKSTLLNTLAGGYLAKTGNIAGVTRSSAWIKLDKSLELMDNAGTLVPKFSDQKVAENLAILGSVGDAVIDYNELALVLIDRLRNFAIGKLEERYNISFSPEDSAEEVLNMISESRGFVLKGGELDLARTASTIIDDFRKTRIGKITLEVPLEGKI